MWFHDSQLVKATRVNWSADTHVVQSALVRFTTCLLPPINLGVINKRRSAEGGGEGYVISGQWCTMTRGHLG